MSKDFRAMRKERQGAAQGIAPVTPENVYNVPLAPAAPSYSETVSQGHSETGEELVVKTSFYPTQDQLDKLDDLATEYNRRYRRQRKKINRNDIIRYLIEQCSAETLDQLTL